MLRRIVSHMHPVASCTASGILILGFLGAVSSAYGQPSSSGESSADESEGETSSVSDSSSESSSDGPSPAPSTTAPAPSSSVDIGRPLQEGGDATSSASLKPPVATSTTGLKERPPPGGTGGPIEERRPRPDYDGVPEPGPSPEEVILWVPRVITSPLYLVSEFVVRRPVGALVTALEQVDLRGLAEGVFLFADNRVGLFPTAFFDFGFVPSFGLYFFWDEFLFKANRLSIHGGTFGPDWLSGVVNNRIQIGERGAIAFRFGALRRPDMIFGGIGTDATTDVARFGISQIDGSVNGALQLLGRSRIRAEFGYRSASFSNEGFLGDPSIGEQVVGLGQSLPAAFSTGYSSVRLRLDAVLDTRRGTFRPGSGVVLGTFGAAHGAFGGLDSFNEWIRWGGNLAGYTGFLGEDRVLSLEADVELISTIDGAEVPFMELIDIGETGPMFGFLPGLIRGRSMAALTAAYTWPIWVFLDGRFHFTVGNAFDENLEGFDVENLRMSFGLGIEPTLGGELPFEFTVALGTDTFDEGAGITSVRLFVGARNAL